MTNQQLINYLQKLPLDVELFVGIGETAKPLNFISLWGDGIRFDNDLYGEEPLMHNLTTVLSILTKNSKL